MATYPLYVVTFSSKMTTLSIVATLSTVDILATSSLVLPVHCGHLSIDCASLARIRTLGPVKVREFVSFMRLSNVRGTIWDQSGPKNVRIRARLAWSIVATYSLWASIRCHQPVHFGHLSTVEILATCPLGPPIHCSRPSIVGIYPSWSVHCGYLSSCQLLPIPWFGKIQTCHNSSPTGLHCSLFTANAPQEVTVGIEESPTESIYKPQYVIKLQTHSSNFKIQTCNNSFPARLHCSLPMPHKKPLLRLKKAQTESICKPQYVVKLHTYSILKLTWTSNPIGVRFSMYLSARICKSDFAQMDSHRTADTTINMLYLNFNRLVCRTKTEGAARILIIAHRSRTVNLCDNSIIEELRRKLMLCMLYHVINHKGN